MSGSRNVSICDIFSLLQYYFKAYTFVICILNLLENLKFRQRKRARDQGCISLLLPNNALGSLGSNSQVHYQKNELMDSKKFWEQFQVVISYASNPM